MCQPALAAERKQSVEWWTRLIEQPKHVVLTIKPLTYLTSAGIKRLRGWFNKLRRSTLGQAWGGGFWSFEATWSPIGWHLHIHALIDCRWIDSRQLSAKWHRITGGAGFIVKVKDVRDKKYLQEVAKYAMKGSDVAELPAEKIKEFIDAFSGLQSFTVFGSLRGARGAWKEFLAERTLLSRTCECGCTEFRYMTEDEFEAWSVAQEHLFAPRPPPDLNERAANEPFLPGLDVRYEG